MAVQPSSLSDNPFKDLDVPTLTQLRDTFLQAIVACAVAGASYVANGRTFTSADLKELKLTLAEVNQAIKLAGGNVRQWARPDMRNAR